MRIGFKQKSVWFVFVVAGCFATGRAESAEPRPAVAQPSRDRLFNDPTADITGIVLNNRQPVAGAIVQAKSLGWAGGGWGVYITEEVVADKNGKFAITVRRRRLSGITFIARTADSRRMGLLRVGVSGDVEDAFERYQNADPIRMKDLEIWLAPAVSQTVHVADDQGKPVPAADVAAYVFSEWPFAKTKTDKAGTAEFWLPPAVSSAEFFAWKTGIGLDCAKAVLAEGEKAPLKLALRKAPTVPVRVVDALTNQPLPGVAVQCTIPRKRRSGVIAGTRGMEISAKTDGAGFAKIDWLPEWSVEEKITVWGEHPGYDADVGEMVLGKDKQITVKLAPLVRLRGRVLDQDGKPASGIVVEAAKGREMFRERAITDQNGHYELAVRPDLKYVVIVVNDKWAAEPVTEFAVQEPGISAKAPDIRLTPAKRVHGKLTTEDKTPIAGQQIWLHLYGPPRGEKRWPNKNLNRDNPHATLTTWTDKNGRYEFPIGPAAFRIQGPTRLESADGVHYLARGYSYWSGNLPASEKALEQDFARPVWTGEP